jgi:hypothetical protein
VFHFHCPPQVKGVVVTAGKVGAEEGLESRDEQNEKWGMRD